MKVVLANGNTYAVVSARRSFFVERDVVNISIEIPSSILSLDEAISIFTKENCSKLTIERDGKEALEYTNLYPTNISQNLDSNMDMINIFMDEQSEEEVAAEAAE